MIVAVLTLVNGLLAMSELAVVSSRPARLKVLAAEGKRGATVALKLQEDPGKFLSSVQIGITLVGVLSGAFSGATLGERLGDTLIGAGINPTVAAPLGVGIVVIIITYLSLIVGELVPKQIALRDSEGVAARVAPAMALIASIAAPLVWLLDISGKLVLRLLGQSGETDERVTDEEVKTLIAEAEHAGVLETEERHMISGVMRFADRSARGLMTPRLDVELIDLSETQEEMIEKLRATRHSVLPVQDGAVDTIVGVIVRKDLVENVLAREPLDMRTLVKQAPVVMDRSSALDVLKAIRGSLVHMALVFDEYGHFEGIVTPGDILEAITGAFQEEEGDEKAYVTRQDGSYLVSGWMQVDEFQAHLGVPVPKDAKFETVAGFVLAELNHLPAVGETFERGHWRFEVLDLDGRRIDKILVTRLN
ncbi:DNA-binding protein [Devosia sp. Root413D1]|uniref:hemolysin family protein n=1 Tax=Devosia sp. Root413D1 TaxID=1736531 RepID=UPI0006FA8CE3|nr:hemolysin family protein [Devosia sp. Root413D1]KQW80680.1 DNA-binding protein [Devosia sp. Root413D1]